MKYPRGAYLMWTPKAIRREDLDAAERMVVLDKDTVMSVFNGVVEQLDVLKTQDSMVTLAPERRPDRLRVDAAEVKRCHADALVAEFKLIVTSKYEGRRY